MTIGGLSIQRRLRLIMMATTTVVLLLAGVASTIVDFVSLGEITRRDLKTLSQVMALDSTAGLTFGDHETVHDLLDSLRAKPSVQAAAIFDRDGRLFETYSRGGGTFAPRTLGSLARTRRADRIEIFTDIIFDGEKIGTLYIAASRELLLARAKQYLLALAAILIVSLLLAFVLSSKLPGIITAPIAQLARAAREVTRHDNYEVRVAEVGASAPREVADLVIAFNQMLREIDRQRDDLEQQVESRTAELSVVVDRNQAILDSAGEGIFGLDLDGIVTFMNPSAARILGSGMSLVGRSLHSHIHASTCPDRLLAYHDCRVCGARLDPLVRTGRGRFIRFDTAPVPIEYTSCTIVDERGHANGVVVTFRDISQQLAVEKMKDEFVSTVSHELRTPLTSIRGALGLLGSGLLGNIDPRAQRMVDIAVTNTDRLVRLINDILDLERIDSGRVELSRDVVETAALMTEAVEGIQAFADRAGVAVVADAVPAALWGDRDRIIQTLTNLLSNAVKFSPGGTTVRLSGSSSEGVFTFAVEDQGRGIPKDHLESVFERFKQVDASDSRSKGGTGLGLAICRSIVAAHGGRIWAESEEGKGTIFRFTIPLYEEAWPDTANEGAPVVVAFAGRNLVDTIRRGDFRVEVAERRSEIGALAIEAHPDVVVIDLTLPGSSWDLVRRLKGNPLTREIPIVVAANSGEPLGQYAELIASWLPSKASEDDVTRIIGAVCERPTALVVEDDIDLARVITASLEAHGIRTRHVVSGRCAVAACEDEMPSVMILDLVLPEMDGFEVVEWMRARQKLARVPLVVYTAHEVSQSDQQRLRLGPTEFMTKSRVSPEEFEQRVVELLATMTAEQEVEGAA